MASNKFVSVVAMIAATTSVAAFAGCTPGTPGQVTPTKTPTPGSTATPAPGSTATPGSDVAPGPGATATPTPVPSTPDTSTKATVHGEVYDDLGSRLDGVTVNAKILGGGTFANGSDQLTVTSQVGSYALNGAPTGETILITVTKAGMTTRQQTIVPLSNLEGNTEINNVTFGKNIKTGAQELVFAMSDKPEVTSFTPAKDATGVDKHTSFTLNFNEPVNTADVESGFAIFVNGPRTEAKEQVFTGVAAPAGNEYTLSVSEVDALKLDYTFDSNRDDGTTSGTPVKVRNADSPIYDSASFTAAWTNNNQTVTFTFRPGAHLPTDKDSSRLPQYAVSFKNVAIRDAAGTGRNDTWFRVSPVQVGRVGYKFTVAADTTAPRLSGITPINKDDADAGDHAHADRIRVQFSETMALFPGNLGGNSIPRAADSSGRNATQVANYLYYVSEVGTTEYPSGGSVIAVGSTVAPGVWNPYSTSQVAQQTAAADGGHLPATGAAPNNTALLGTAATAPKFYDGDATRSTVEITPVTDAVVAGTLSGGVSGFTTGRNVWVNVRSNVTDPAGNGLDTTNNSNIKSGIAQ